MWKERKDCIIVSLYHRYHSCFAGWKFWQGSRPIQYSITPSGFNLHNLYALSNKSIHSVLPLQDSDNITYIPETVLPPPLTYTQKIPMIQWYNDTSSATRKHTIRRNSGHSTTAELTTGVSEHPFAVSKRPVFWLNLGIFFNPNSVFSYKRLDFWWIFRIFGVYFHQF